MKSIEIFLNFPVADMNRNVLWRKPDEVSRSQIKRMNRFWGDGSWRETTPRASGTLPDLSRSPAENFVLLILDSKLL